MECRVCGAEGDHADFRAREMMFGTREVFDYFQCHSCGCLQISTTPLDLGRHYPEDYYSLSAAPAPEVPGFFTRRLQKERCRTALFGKGYKVNAVLKRLIPLPGAIGPYEGGLAVGEMVRKFRIRDFSARILDVGCGSYSHWLASLERLGFTNLSGIDPYIAQTEIRHRGFSVLQRSIAEVQGSYDVITMHHVLEHLPDQRDALRHVARLLVSDGVFLARIPIVPSEVWNRYGVDWVELDAPRHLFLHSLESIRRLATESGLEVFEVVYDSLPFEFYGSELYRRDIPLTDRRSPWVNPESKFFSPEEMATFESMAREANKRGQGGRAGIYMRKASS